MNMIDDAARQIAALDVFFARLIDGEMAARREAA
jgi:hypothetical protein